MISCFVLIFQLSSMESLKLRRQCQRGGIIKSDCSWIRLIPMKEMYKTVTLNRFSNPRGGMRKVRLIVIMCSYALWLEKPDN